MVTYQGKEVYDVFKGDIIAVKKNIYIDFPGRPWHEHFFLKEQYIMWLKIICNAIMVHSGQGIFTLPQHFLIR